MKRWTVPLLMVGCLATATGCYSTAAKRVLGEVVQFKTRHLEIEGGAANWTSYEAFEFGRISDAPLSGRVPAELKAELVPLASEQLAKGRLFKRVGGSGREKTLVLTGEIIDYDSGSSGGARAIGFGEEPFVTVRAKFIDKASGKVVSEVNLQSASKSLRDWSEMVSRGFGKAIENYLKTKGMQKLPEETA